MPGKRLVQISFSFLRRTRCIFGIHYRKHDVHGRRSRAWKTHCTLCFVDSFKSAIQRGLSRCLFSVFLKWLMRWYWTLVFQHQALPWLTFRFPKCFPPIFYCVVTQYFLCVAMGRLTPGKRDIQIWLNTPMNIMFSWAFPSVISMCEHVSESIFVWVDNSRIAAFEVMISHRFSSNLE